MQLTEDLPGVVLPTPWMDDRRERDYLVTDENGCATNPPFFGEWQYEKQLCLQCLQVPEQHQHPVQVQHPSVLRKLSTPELFW